MTNFRKFTEIFSPTKSESGSIGTATFCRPEGSTDVGELGCDGESVGWRSMNPSAVELAAWCNATAACIRTHAAAVLSAATSTSFWDHCHCTEGEL